MTVNILLDLNDCRLFALVWYVCVALNGMEDNVQDVNNEVSNFRVNQGPGDDDTAGGFIVLLDLVLIIKHCYLTRTSIGQFYT